MSDATLAGLVKELRRALGNDSSGVVIRTAHRVASRSRASGRLSCTLEVPLISLIGWLWERRRSLYGRART